MVCLLPGLSGLSSMQGGAIKLYKGLACPLCSYELLLFSLGGADGKSLPLCPFCYNNPLEGAAGLVSCRSLSMTGWSICSRMRC